MLETTTKPTFEELFSNTLVKEVIDEYVNKQVEKVRIEKEKEITELKVEVEKQKALNSQILLEMAKIKQGGAV